MAMFNPEPHQKYICMYKNDDNSKEEFDNTLYYDEHKKNFFVVKSKEYKYRSASPSHKIEQITREELEKILSEDAECETKAKQYLPKE